MALSGTTTLAATRPSGAQNSITCSSGATTGSEPVTSAGVRVAAGGGRGYEGVRGRAVRVWHKHRGPMKIAVARPGLPARTAACGRPQPARRRAKRAGLEHRRIYDMRHTFATWSL